MNQLLSLFFVVMVQVVIMAEWFVLNMPIAAIVSSSGNLHCDVPKVRGIHIFIGTKGREHYPPPCSRHLGQVV